MMAEMNDPYKIPTNASALFRLEEVELEHMQTRDTFTFYSPKEVTSTTKTHSESEVSVLKAGQVLP